MILTPPQNQNKRKGEGKGEGYGNGEESIAIPLSVSNVGVTNFTTIGQIISSETSLS